MKDRIKAVRKNHGLTQTEFGEKIGATRPMVASYEGGAVVPSDSILMLISKEFNISYAWLKTGEGPMIDPVAEDATLDRLTETYQSLPERLKSLVDALSRMTPDWYKLLDEAFQKIESRKKKGETD